jgi:hypothetical protein
MICSCLSFVLKTVSKLVIASVVDRHRFDPEPNPLVRGMDPWIQIRIRIHPKMSWIRNTAFMCRSFLKHRHKKNFLHQLKSAILSKVVYWTSSCKFRI